MSTVGGREWFVDLSAPGWLVARQYGIPTSILAAATERRLAGDWRGACAAANVEVLFDLHDIRDRCGTEVAAQVEDDLVHLAPDLVRWHAPRTVPGRSEAGWLDPRRRITLATYGDGLRLWVATEPYLYRPQRLALHCGRRGAERIEDWRPARYLWDVRATHLLLKRLGGGDRTPFFHRDGTPLSTVELADPDPADPVALREQTIMLADEGEFVAAWAMAGVRLEPPHLRHQHDRKVALLVAMVPELVRHVRARLAHPSSSGAIVLRDMPHAGHCLVLRSLDGELRASHDYDRAFQEHRVLPRPLWQRFADLELLRMDRITAAQVHPLVRAAMFPDQPDPGYDPRLPTVDGSGVTVGCAGRSTALAIMRHGDTEAFREVLGAAIDLSDLRDSQGRGPLDHLARLAAPTALLRRLLDAGLDLDARDNLERTPLANVLADGGSAALVRAMLDAGADPLATDRYQNTMLHHLCTRDAAPIIGWLLEAGADLEARNHLQWTPLASQVVNWAPPETIQAMLAAGADPAQVHPHGHQSLVDALVQRDDLDVLIEAAATVGVDLSADALRRTLPGRPA